jgi:transcription elongation factor Elf1
MAKTTVSAQRIRTDPCPSCGAAATAQETLKNGQVFQFIDCQNCHTSWARVVNGSGNWILLRPIDDRGLLLSHKPGLKA